MKRLILTLMMAACALGIASQAAAQINIYLQPNSQQTINVGGDAVFGVWIQGLQNPPSAALGAFVLDVTYDPSVVSAPPGMVTFGTMLNLGDPLGSLQTADDNSTDPLVLPGNIVVTETSFESTADLTAAQGDSFLLAMIDFHGIGAGWSPIGIDLADSSLSDALGNSLQFGVVNSDKASVLVNSIPDSASTFSLMMAAFSGLAILRQKMGVPR